MSTITPPARPNPAPASRAQQAPAPSSGALALATLDPVRLLRRYYPWLIVAAFIGAVLGTAAHFALARFHPTYTATATFECRAPVINITQEGVMGGGDDLSRFMATQAAVMVSSSVLEPAVRNPELERSTWARQFVRNGAFQPRDAQVALAKELAARPVAQTSLVRLSMSWRDPDAVRTVVDAVADAYREYYRQSTVSSAASRRDVLDRQIKEIDRQIAERNERRNRQLAEQKVTDLREGSTVEDQRVNKLTDTVVTTMKELTTTRSLLQNYEQRRNESIVVILPDDIIEEVKRDPVVGSLEGQLANLRTDEASLLKQGYGPEHPTVVSIRKRIEATDQERDNVSQATGVKLFDAQIDRLRTSEIALTNQLAEASRDLEETSKRKEDLTRLSVLLQQIDEEIQRLSQERADLISARNNQEALAENDVFMRVQLIQPAQRPNEMAFPKLTILLPLGVLLVTGLVAGVLVLREILDQRVKGPADVALIPRMRVLGMIPEASEDPVKAANLETAFRDAPTGAVSESFRQLRAPLTKAMDQAGFRSVLVQAGMPGSGATTVVTNLALACAGAGERVLVIDGNLRRPAVHRVFGLPDGPGLGDCLAGQSDLAQAITATRTPGLSVLPAGTAANRMLPERLSSETMSRLLADASANFDRVIIDAPPMIVAGDGMAIANRCDATVLVVRALSEKRGLVNRLRGQLAESRAEFLGVVVNAVRSSAGGYFKGNIRATHEYQTQSK